MKVSQVKKDESYANAFRFWTDHYPLLTAKEEVEWLTKHETLYFQLLKEVHVGRREWFAERYVELDLTGDDWLDVLWHKRPFMKDVIEAAKQNLDKKKNSSITSTMSELNQVREHLMASNIRLVMKVAHQHYDDTLSFFDLVQEGQFGLMRAMERFETGRGLRFSTYATHWVTQFIRLAIKKSNRLVRIPTNVQDQMQRVKKAMIQSQQNRGRGGISRTELAQITDLDSKAVDDMSQMMQPVYSLHERRHDDSDQMPIDDLDSNTPSPEAINELAETQAHVNELLDSLPARERLILRMRYGIDMPQEYGYREIADQLDLSRERVRQIELELVKKLRRTNSA